MNARRLLLTLAVTAVVGLPLLWRKPGITTGFIHLGKNVQGYDEYLCVADSAVMIHIPAGQFVMGANRNPDEQPVRLPPPGVSYHRRSSSEYPDEQPVHGVYLDEFLVDKHEVTNRQYKRFCDATGKSYPSDPGFWDMPDYFIACPDHPVLNVSWYDAKAYCEWAGKRLPTEAEWEKAARGADARKHPWGNSEPGGTRCNILDNPDGYRHTSPVGVFPAGASPYGALDMAGNVWEWCNDWYEIDYYSKSPSHNPPGPTTGSSRVIRGGSWCGLASGARCAFRCGFEPSVRIWNYGFRCAAHR